MGVSEHFGLKGLSFILQLSTIKDRSSRRDYRVSTLNSIITSTCTTHPPRQYRHTYTILVFIPYYASSKMLSPVILLGLVAPLWNSMLANALPTADNDADAVFKYFTGTDPESSNCRPLDTAPIFTVPSGHQVNDCVPLGMAIKALSVTSYGPAPGQGRNFNSKSG